ncbi:MAG: phospholipid transport system transporter-binding protein [Oleiphilaceae bacterium]
MALVVEINEKTISLIGDVLSPENHSNILNCRSKLEKAIALSSGKSLQINLAQLNAVSSVVLSLLLCFIRTANKVSCELTFVNMSQDLFDMARVGGIESLFPPINN